MLLEGSSWELGGLVSACVFGNYQKLSGELFDTCAHGITTMFCLEFRRLLIFCKFSKHTSFVYILIQSSDFFSFCF